MSNREKTRIRTKSRLPFGQAITVLAVTVKGICGVLLALISLQAWNQIVEMEERQEVADDWADSRQFAVFFPHKVGNDLAELQTGGHATKIVEANELYLTLNEKGALFIDAGNYTPGLPEDPDPVVPAMPIQVNTNYLDHYPILDDSGVPIAVDHDERAWVIAVPEKFKEQEAEIEAFFRATRIGDQGFDGAVQAQEDMLGEPVPDHFRDQKLRIIWTTSGQEVFTFNSTINPESGNMIVDPIVEIMTPSNSLTIDRLNSITGDINTALKVRVDGDPASALHDLTPTLQELHLDDNLPHLVTPNEAMLQELNEIRRGIAWTTVTASGALVIMLVFSAALVTIISDRLRRTLIVRRLHGFGFLRAYRELFVFLGVLWLAQALVACILVALQGTAPGPSSSAATDHFADIPPLLVILIVTSIVELLFAAMVASAVEHRNAVKRLKEL